MKTLFTMLLITAATFGQNTEYNKNKVLKTSPEFGVWVKYNGDETFLVKNTPVGVFESYTELNAVLDFYGFDINSPAVDQTLINRLATGLDDFEMLSHTLTMQTSVIKKGWKNDKVTLVWIGNNNCLILTIKKR